MVILFEFIIYNYALNSLIKNVTYTLCLKITRTDTRAFKSFYPGIYIYKRKKKCLQKLNDCLFFEMTLRVYFNVLTQENTLSKYSIGQDVHRIIGSAPLT